MPNKKYASHLVRMTSQGFHALPVVQIPQLTTSILASEGCNRQVRPKNIQGFNCLRTGNGRANVPKQIVKLPTKEPEYVKIQHEE